jgi:hypothetical protein
MILLAHVYGSYLEPKLATGHPTARELPRGRQDQKPNPANLSRWPAERIEQLRAVRGDQLLPAAEAVEIVRSLPHGHVLATLGAARRIALEVTAKNENLERARNSRTTVVPEPPIRLSPSGSLLRTCSNPVSGNPPARSPTSGDAAAHQIQ